MNLPDFVFDDAGRGLYNGLIEEVSAGLITCRLCKRFEPMTVYLACWRERLHFFGLHPSCAKAYFTRLKEGDIIVLIEVERLACVGGPKRSPQIFSMERID